ncbi:MAG TPA: hypothetical protein VIY08_11565 [Candidatus Nitrosocosmicus sp.]
MSVGKDTPILLSNLNGVKYNNILPNGILETQILIVKDSHGIVITYVPEITNQTKNITDINSIINSLTIKPNSQSIDSMEKDNSNNTTSRLKYPHPK